MKRILSVLLAILMLAGVAPAAVAEAAHEITMKDTPMYIGDVENLVNIPLYFMDGVEDLPWVALDDWRDVMDLIYKEWGEDAGYVLTYALEGSKAVFTRENEYTMVVDFYEDSITFNDYNGFLHNSRESSLLDILSENGFNEAGEAELFQRNNKASFDRAGDAVTLDLRGYDIDIVLQDGKGYVPLQTLSDFLVAPQALMCAFYNGEAVFFANSDIFGDAENGYTPLGELYYSAEPCERSDALAEYGYSELCLALDSLYGLKEIHDIDNFSQLFWQIGYDEVLSGRDPVDADVALYDFIDFYLDDLHSAFLGYSWMSGSDEVGNYVGTSNIRYDTKAARYTAARAQALGDEPPAYQEVGNTAYITFDGFKSNPARAYYAALEGEKLPDDTISLMILAHQNIYREDSPIENVVFDLSCNGGGSVDAALFVMAWVLGDAPFCVKDTFTGALSSVLYRADVNLDRVFSSGDELDDKRIYCLISPMSFSCGNLVPAAFKASDRVTLMGRTSGGGSCTVLPMSTAWGSIFQISSNKRMSFLKNGSYYDIDQGFEPDVYIDNIAGFYDREALTERINALY